MKHRLAQIASWVYLGGMYVLLPMLPLLATVMFWRRSYLVNYAQTLRKATIHLAALRKGPAVHFFEDILGRVSKVPDEVQGSCVQCGNCCMNHQCMFLVPVAANQFQCGIYHSPLRALSNCGSFPLNHQDIERYACPSYFVESKVSKRAVWPIQAVPVGPIVHSSKEL